MKTKMLLLVAMALILAGCGAANKPTTEVIPTVVLDAGGDSTNSSQPVAAAAMLSPQGL